MIGSIDIWTVATLLLLPFWIAAFTWLTGKLMDLPMPIYMGLAAPLTILGLAVPVGMAARYVDRTIIYDECVTHENARDPMNRCPAWTLRALAEAGRTGA